MNNENLDWAGKIALCLCDLIFKPFIKVENDQVLSPDMDSAVFAINHNNAIETVIVATCLIKRFNGRKVSFIVDWLFAQIPVLGWLISKIDPIYVYSKPAKFKIVEWIRRKYSSKEAVFEECVRRIKYNRSLIGVFPEGKINSCPTKLKKGRKGIGYIVLNTNARVFPIGIDFPSRLKEKKIPFFGKTILRIGEEMNFAHEKSEFLKLTNDSSLSEQEKRTAVSYLVQSVTDSIMREISKLSGKAYPYPKPLQKCEQAGLQRVV